MNCFTHGVKLQRSCELNLRLDPAPGELVSPELKFKGYRQGKQNKRNVQVDRLKVEDF